MEVTGSHGDSNNADVAMVIAVLLDTMYQLPSAVS